MLEERLDWPAVFFAVFVKSSWPAIITSIGTAATRHGHGYCVFALWLPLVLFMPVVVMVIMMGVIGVVILVLVVLVLRIVVIEGSLILILPVRLA